MLSLDNHEGSDDMPSFKFGDHESRKIPLPAHTMDILIKWQNAAPESVPYIFLTKERYEIVKAKWHQLRKQKKPWRNGYMDNNTLRNFKQHCRRSGIKPAGKLTFPGTN